MTPAHSPGMRVNKDVALNHCEAGCGIFSLLCFVLEEGSGCRWERGMFGSLSKLLLFFLLFIYLFIF
jgi:hypothetical protein